MKLNDNMIIHISNKIENEKFLKMCEDLEVEDVQDFYNVYYDKTCYHIENYHLYYSFIDYYKSEGENIIEFKDLEK